MSRRESANGGLSPPGTRVFVLLLVLVSILWIPVVQASQGGQLFIYIQSISSYLQPPVAVVFIMGCFWKQTNEKVALHQPPLCWSQVLPMRRGEEGRGADWMGDLMPRVALGRLSSVEGDTERGACYLAFEKKAMGVLF